MPAPGGASVLVYRLFVIVKRRMLWRVRRKLTLSYIFIGVVPAAGGPARVLVGENEPYDVDRAMWSKDGKSIYFVANLGVHEELFLVPAAGGKPRQLTNGKHNVGAVSQSGDHFALTIGDSTSGGEIWTMAASDVLPAM